MRLFESSTHIESSSLNSLNTLNIYSHYSNYSNYLSNTCIVQIVWVFELSRGRPILARPWYSSNVEYRWIFKYFEYFEYFFNIRSCLVGAPCFRCQNRSVSYSDNIREISHVRRIKDCNDSWSNVKNIIWHYFVGITRRKSDLIFIISIKNDRFLDFHKKW